MDLKDDVYEPLLIIERAKWAQIPFTEYLALSSYWQGWITIGHAATARANKQRELESS